MEQKLTYTIIRDIIILVLIILLGLACYSNWGKIFPKAVHNTYITKDTTIFTASSTPAPKVYVSNNISNDSLIAIIKRFQQTNPNVYVDTNCKRINLYADTLQNDTNLFVAVYDTTQGQLLGRRFDIRN